MHIKIGTLPYTTNNQSAVQDDHNACTLDGTTLHGLHATQLAEHMHAHQTRHSAPRPARQNQQIVSRLQQPQCMHIKLGATLHGLHAPTLDLNRQFILL